MTPTEVKSIVLAWLDYQDHDHTLPGHMGPERIEHFSRKMAEQEQAELKPAELTAEDFIKVPELESMDCSGCYFENTECYKNPLVNKLGDCGDSHYEYIFKLKEAAK